MKIKYTQLKLLHIVKIMLALAAATGCAASQATTIKLGNDGQIDIDIPATWKSTVERQPKDDKIAYSVDLMPDNNAKLYCSFLIVAAPEFSGMPRDLLAFMAQQTQDSTKKKIPTKPLKVANGYGVYYMETNRKLGQLGQETRMFKDVGNYFIIYGENIFVTLMLASDNAKGAEFQSVEKAILGMRPFLNTPGPTPKIKTTKVKQGIQLSSAISPKKLIIPSKSLKDRKSSKQEQENPGWFYFEDTKTNILMSGWLEPANKFRFSSVREMWDSDNAKRTTSARPKADSEEYQKVGDWDVYLYDAPVPAQFKNTSSTHIRANYNDGAIWIDLHLSLTRDRPSKELRDALVAYLKMLVISDAEPAK